MRTTLAAIILIGAPLLAGGVGAMATSNAPVFFGQLAKPGWAPPSWLFGPVWTALYLLMGVAAFLVWRSHGWHPAIALFLGHLVVNALWSWMFFAWRQGTGSSAVIVVLWVLIAALVVWFFRLRSISGLMLLPYLGWVTYATALNFALVRINPTLLR